MISEICFMESSEKWKSKVLVTGSNGLLGQKLTDLFIARKDWDFVATGTGKNRHPLVDGYRYESMDVTDSAAMKAVLTRELPDVVIHTAAMTQVDD